MATLKIVVTGNHSITLAPERAILHLRISSTSPLQYESSQTVTITSNHLQILLKSLSPKTLSGDTQPDAPVTKWTMSSLSTSSTRPWVFHAQKTEAPQPTYIASTDFEVTFQNFEKLGAVATEMAEMTGVEVRRVQWVLTEETKKRHAKVARQAAVRDAMDKAGDYASAAGKENVTVVEISESPVRSSSAVSVPPTMFGSGGAVTRGGGAPQEQRLSFEPENREVSCQVTAVFQAV